MSFPEHGDLLESFGRNGRYLVFTWAYGMSNTAPAIEYLASAYEEMGYKVVAMALRKHGANAAKFKVEMLAVETAIRNTRQEDAAIADRLDKSGEVGMLIRQAAGITQTQGA
jgi:hypothetical protein